MQYVFFFRVGEENGFFSNWWKSNFVVDGIQFNCVEQYMMWSKAKVFGDKVAMQEILHATNPSEIKRLGRKVKGFDDSKWNSVKFGIVVNGCYNKFKQNENLKKKLLATGDSILVEASPYDKVWGIGLGPTDPRRMDSHKWLGQNLLGQALCEARKMIREERNE